MEDSGERDDVVGIFSRGRRYPVVGGGPADGARSALEDCPDCDECGRGLVYEYVVVDAVTGREVVLTTHHYEFDDKAKVFRYVGEFLDQDVPL